MTKKKVMTNKVIFKEYCPICTHYNSGDVQFSTCTTENVTWLLKNGSEHETFLCSHYEPSFEGLMREIIKEEDDEQFNKSEKISLLL